MKFSLARPILGALLVIFGWTNTFAQLELGPQRLVDSPAPQLRNPTRVRVGLRRPIFLKTVGGIAFDGLASPAEGTSFNSLTFRYRPELPDGRRFALAVDGRPVAAPIYDWQLVPIAKFADSNFYSCFTYFGRLDSFAEEELVRERGGKVLNYHPAFENTLLGLRLFQLDMLIFNPYSYELVKERGRYLLGAGESPPNTDANRKALNDFGAYLEKIGGTLDNTYESYVISDHGRDIRFDFRGGSLNINGEPSYYFWKGSFAELETLAEIAKDLGAAQRLAPANFDPKEWLIADTLARTRKFEAEVGVAEAVEVLAQTELSRLLKLEDDEARRNFLRQQSGTVVLRQLNFLRVADKSFSVVELQELSQQISGQTNMLRSINPAVWDAGTAVMRYSAFFRYLKKEHPQQWQEFMGRIRHRVPRPPVTTPTVLEATR